MNEEEDDPPLTNRAARMADIYADKGQVNLKGAAIAAEAFPLHSPTPADDPRFDLELCAYRTSTRAAR